MQLKTKIQLAVLVVLTIALGFLRDYEFVYLNQTIRAGNDAGGGPLILKWILTLLFSAIYFLITYGFLRLIFSSEKHLLLSALSYGLLLFVALAAAAAGYFLSSFGNFYPFIRNVAGLAQSPVVAMILIAGCHLKGKYRK